MPKTEYSVIIDKYYPADRKVRGILLTHSRNVADLALEILRQKNLQLDPQEVETAAMLHDIGIIFTDADGIDCFGDNPYIRHGVIGAELLRKEGVDEIYARVAERHTGAGLTLADIQRLALPLSVDTDLVPETQLERLICYADCFYSKTKLNQRKPFERIQAGMARYGDEVLARFNALADEFKSD